jgi:hypothetical protein
MERVLKKILIVDEGFITLDGNGSRWLGDNMEKEINFISGFISEKTLTSGLTSEVNFTSRIDP